MFMNFVFFFNSILLGAGLAMDAFSVSLADGLNEPKMKKRRICMIADVPQKQKANLNIKLLIMK